MTGFLSETAFAGRTVVLIGGGTGIGRSVAGLVTAAGGEVVLGGRTAATLAGHRGRAPVEPARALGAPPGV